MSVNVPTQFTEFETALKSNNLDQIERLLNSHPDIVDSLNKHVRPLWRPALAAATSVDAAKLLLSFGAKCTSVAEWWRPGFYLSDMNQNVGRFLIEQGTEATVHVVAALGLVDVLENMLDDEPDLVHKKGGDDGTPLHFSRDVETARLLVNRGAKIDARDSDHNSTAAQWLIGHDPEIARYLFSQDAEPDIFMAAALGDRKLVDQLIVEDPQCLSYRVGKPPFPGIGHEGNGGTILQWSLGFNSYAHQYAKAKGHDELFRYMFERSDTTTQFLVACCLAMRNEAETIAAKNPGLVESLPDIDKELLARYCWETNSNIDAVRLMLDLGFPIDHPETSHCYSPLHNAAFGGYADVVDLLIERGASVDLRDPEHDSTPLGHAIYCCTEDGRHPEGEYARVVESLIRAGAPWDAHLYPTGSEQIDRVLEQFLRKTMEGVSALGDLGALNEYLKETPETNALIKSLVAAANARHFDLCARLLDVGTPIALPEDKSWTPMHAAVAGGSVDILELLISRGGDVHLLNGRGGTVWHTVACFRSSQEMIDCLIKHGALADINKPSHFNYTPLDLAEMYCGGAIVERLKKLGAVTSNSSN